MIKIRSFISLEEAVDILDSYIENLGKEEVPLLKGVKRIIGEDVHSKIDNPPFNKSAMDGYAVIAEDTMQRDISLKVIDEVFAGYSCTSEVTSGTAIKIMTGAPIPKGANVVIKQEDVTIEDNYIKLNKTVNLNENVCFKGEDIQEGSLLISKNKKLNYADIGILASSGISKIKVYKTPKVAFISTGDEVVDIDEDLGYGKIYNSNKYSILGRLEELNYEVSYISHEKDSAIKIGEEIKKASNISDLIITTGGASVGEKDLIKEAIDSIGGEKVFWKVKIKPGSAIVCSRFNNKLIISLSGNPTAALTTFELLVRTILEKLSGSEKVEIKREKAILMNDYLKKSPQRKFLRGEVLCNERGQNVFLTQFKSGNGILSSTLNSNCLIEIGENNDEIKKGTLVDIIKF
ncbi:MAG: molybdopterin molybdotransferase MoeA [Clostridium sp.]